MNINYIYKIESDKSFKYTGSKIELKEFEDDLVFYTPLNSYKADFALIDNTMNYDTKPDFFTGGTFGSYIKLKDYVKFDGRNLQTLGSQGRISFYLSVDKLHGSNSICLKNNLNGKLEAGDYSILIKVGSFSNTLVFSLKEDDTFETIKNYFLFNLDPSYNVELDLVNSVQDKIVLKSTLPNETVEVENGSQGFSLLGNCVVLESADNGSIPINDNTVLEFGNFKVIHTSKNLVSYLKFIISDGISYQEIEVPWNNDTTLDNIEVDFDEQVFYVFINGKLEKIELLNIKRASSNEDLIIRGTQDDAYRFDELIINNKIVNRTDFIPSDRQLTKYNTSKPFIDFYFNEAIEGMKLDFFDQKDCHACINDGGKFYYYNAGSWRSSDGSFSKTNDLYEFKNQINNFAFDNKDYFIRVYFDSDGVQNSYLDGFSFSVEDELEDKDGNTCAILVGEKEIVEENLLDKTLVIKTDKGTTEINFNDFREEYIDEPLLFTINDLIEFINSYYPFGINKVLKDSKNRVVLYSETLGEEAFISVSGNAAPIIFGQDLFSSGSNLKSGGVDYKEFFHKVRTYTGDDLLAIEATDEQILLFLKEALDYYKKFKGDCLSQHTCQLEGDWINGFEIPSVIERNKDIVDILFRPVFPIKFYGEELVGNSDDIVTLSMANYLFGANGGARLNGGIAQDYYISLMSLQDFKQTLGLNPKWEILNGKIYIYPSNIARYTKVSIIYKSAISIEEAINDSDIIKYVSGKILMLIGNIRGAYGATLSSGSVPAQMNADALYERGKTMVDTVYQTWETSQPPLGFFLG